MFINDLANKKEQTTCQTLSVKYFAVYPQIFTILIDKVLDDNGLGIDNIFKNIKSRIENDHTPGRDVQQCSIEEIGISLHAR